MILVGSLLGAYFEKDAPGALAVLIAVGIPVLILIWKPRRQKPRPGGVPPVNGYDFEYWCADYLLRNGFREARVTKASGDYGADIVAVDRDGNRWVVQCKRYTRPVGNSAVQEVLGAKNHYGANKALVMTNSRITKQARELAWENAVAIIEGLGD